MCKDINLFNNVIFKHHPAFKSCEILRSAALEHPKGFRAEHWIELTMALLGGYEFTDVEHKDFSDGTECKTASIRTNPTTKNGSSYLGEISGVGRGKTNIKSGDIRLVLDNPHTNITEYFYVPKSWWADHINWHPTSKNGRVFFTYNGKTGKINKLDAFRKSSFEELALTKPQR